MYHCILVEMNLLKIVPAMAPTGQSGLFSPIIDLT